jgi:hypothetical protein
VDTIGFRTQWVAKRIKTHALYQRVKTYKTVSSAATNQFTMAQSAGGVTYKVVFTEKPV